MTEREWLATDDARAMPGRLRGLYDRTGGRLDPGVAVEGFREEYAGRFLAPARFGLTIEQLVLDRFATPAGPEVVFDAGGRRWRGRYSGER
jgi:hypothetical protein